jgi:AcrR family transcriptional regulator
MVEVNSKKEDLRVRRTYKLLFEALTSLLKESPFEKISVTDICARAMVHRTTFYKHFQDKHELLRWGVKELQKDYNAHTPTNEDFNSPQQYYREIIRRVFDYFAENQKLFAAILVNNENSSFISMFYQLVEEDITAKLEYFQNEGAKHTIPIPVVANFRAGALMSLLKWWVVNDLPYSIDEMVKYVDLMVKYDQY